MTTARDMQGRAVGEAVSSFSLSYSNINLGNGSITFPFPICDVEGNAIPSATGGADSRGTLTLFFRERTIRDEDGNFRDYRPGWVETGLDSRYVILNAPF